MQSFAIKLIVTFTFLFAVVFNVSQPSLSDITSKDGSVNQYYLPIVDAANCTVSIKNITDTEFSKLKNIICWLPQYEQDIIANCYKNNTDETRFIGVDCYKSYFDAIKNVTAIGVTAKLTNYSKITRNSLACILAFTDKFKTDGDTTVTNSIKNQIATMVKMQPEKNFYSVIFAKTIVEILNARRRFLLTTKDNINKTLILDASKNGVGFSYTQNEQDKIVQNFFNYVSGLSTFINEYTNGVLSVESSITQLTSCKSTVSNTNRLLQQNVNQRNLVDSNNNNQNVTRNASKSIDIPSNVSTSVDELLQCVSKNNIAEWNLLKDNLNKFKSNFNNTKTKSSVFKDIFSELSDENSTFISEFNSIYNFNSCSEDYILYCSKDQCTCSGAGCPNNLIGTNKVPQNMASRIAYSNPNTFNNYYMASICCNKAKTLFSTADFTHTGTLYEYINPKSQIDLGKIASKQNNECAKSLISNNSTLKAKCRGQMKDECATKLDKTCYNTGLNNVLPLHLPGNYTYPKQCNLFLSTYSKQTCFEWIIKHIVKGSLNFDYNGFNNLADAINVDSDISFPSTLRLLDEPSSVAQVISDDPTVKDSNSTLDGSIAINDFVVDSSNSNLIPKYETYASELNTTAVNTNVAGEYFSVCKFIMIFAILNILY